MNESNWHGSAATFQVSVFFQQNPILNSEINRTSSVPMLSIQPKNPQYVQKTDSNNILNVSSMWQQKSMVVVGATHRSIYFENQPQRALS